MKHLEPVVKKHSSFSILLLRNDSKVVSFRLNSFWIKFLIIFFALFSSASGVAGYAAHYYWKKYNALQLERSELAEKLGENRRQLGRFAGIEKIKESSLPRSTMTGVITNGEPPADAVNGNSGAPQPNGAAAGVQQPGNGKPADAMSQRSQQNAINTAAGPVTAPGGDAAQNSASAPSQNAVEQPPSETAQADAKNHPAFVDEVQIRSAGAKNYRLSFDLSNKDQQITLNGRVSLSISTRSGARHDITQVNRDTLRFLINRYKKVTTAFTLPNDVSIEDARTLNITVTAENVPVVTYSFPMPAS